MNLYLKCAIPIFWAFFITSPVKAHGIAGSRYFPPTIVVDDPYAANEVHGVVGRAPNTGAGNSNTTAGSVALVGVGIDLLMDLVLL